MTIPYLGPDTCLSKLPPLSSRYASLLLAVVVVFLQIPLWLNPGYFSHDELQWAARAMSASVSELPFVSFWDVRTFQYRPLTFNLWLLLSHALFETPRLFHFVFVLLGTFNVLLLASVLRGAGVASINAFAAALLFGVSPFAVWVHGWVGCLADLIWVGAGLALVWALQRLTTDRGSVLVAALCGLLATTLGLLAKEAALSIPALLALATLSLRFPRHWLAATIASGMVAMLYLGLRLDVLLHPSAGSGYGLDVTAIPRHWLQYQIFAWAVGVNEIQVLIQVSTARWSAFVLLLGLLLLTLWRASPRLAWLWLVAGVLALAPVLVLPMAQNQYGYGYIALSCALLAMAFPTMRRGGRMLIGVLALLMLWHGFQVQTELWRVGRVQAVFSPALAAAAQAQPEGEIRLWPEATARAYVLHRLITDIPAYAGVKLGKRLSMASAADHATHYVSADGTVRAAQDSTP